MSIVVSPRGASQICVAWYNLYVYGWQKPKECLRAAALAARRPPRAFLLPTAAAKAAAYARKLKQERHRQKSAVCTWKCSGRLLLFLKSSEKRKQFHILQGPDSLYSRPQTAVSPRCRFARRRRASLPAGLSPGMGRERRWPPMEDRTIDKRKQENYGHNQK